MTVEEFERAALFYDRTLALEPHAVDALLGKARALTYLGRSVEAIATLDQLLAERWFVGDARYWRALNESELERNDEAWTDIELAAKLLVNAEVPKLAGLIAYRRHELEVSRGEVRRVAHAQPARLRDRLLPRRRAGRAARLAPHRRGAARGVRLPAGGRARATRRRSRTSARRTIRRSGRRRKIARREQYIAKGRRYLATSWFDIAVAYYNLSQPAEARQYAEKVVDDEQFGDRAKEILSRLAKSP